MPPKCIGFASYFLIIMSVVLLVLTLIASQNINILHLSTDNLLPFQAQIGLSLLNSFINTAVAISILNGFRFSRGAWYLWALSYFLINAWQLTDSIYLAPAGLIFMAMLVLLYSKPAQNFFNTKKTKRAKLKSRRVDDAYNIFE